MDTEDLIRNAFDLKELDTMDQQLEEMESWLIGCVNSLCKCDSYLLLPEMHRDDCPYRLAATSKPEGWVSVDEITGKVPPHERILEIVGR